MDFGLPVAFDGGLFRGLFYVVAGFEPAFVAAKSDIEDPRTRAGGRGSLEGCRWSEALGPPEVAQAAEAPDVLPVAALPVVVVERRHAAQASVPALAELPDEAEQAEESPDEEPEAESWPWSSRWRSCRMRRSRRRRHRMRGRSGGVTTCGTAGGGVAG